MGCMQRTMGPVGPRTRFRHAFPLRRRPVIATGPADRRDDSYFDASRSPFFSCMCHVSHLVGHVQASHWRRECGVCCFSYGGALFTVDR